MIATPAEAPAETRLLLIRGARKRRGGVSLAIHGWDRAMYFPNVAKPKRVAEIINDRPWF